MVCGHFIFAVKATTIEHLGRETKMNLSPPEAIMNAFAIGKRGINGNNFRKSGNSEEGVPGFEMFLLGMSEMMFGQLCCACQGLLNDLSWAATKTFSE